MKPSTKMLLMSHRGQKKHDRYDDDHHRESPWSEHSMYAAGVAWAQPGGHDMKEYGEADEHKAMEWTGRMKNADGTTGPHYKPEQAEQLRAAHCPQCKQWEFFTALNMMYSDYCEAAKKMGVDKPDFYACMAKAFLDDEDAGPHKLEKYMEEIPK